MKRLVFLLLTLTLAPVFCRAHSGKARFHIVVDTDGAADDLRALCMLLGNRDAEVLAIVTSDGAQEPARSAACVGGLLRTFHHEGIPVGCGRPTCAEIPAWRNRTERIDWGASSDSSDWPAAPALLAETIENEEEPVIAVALGALTNLDDLLAARPTLKNRIARIIWYNDCSEPLASANYCADPDAAHRVLASGIPTAIVSAAPGNPIPITPALLDSIAAVGSPYARHIAATHRRPPLAHLIDERHLQAWDDLAALYLFAPELFNHRQQTPTVTTCTLHDPSETTFCCATLAVLRGRPDTESRVFYGFPTSAACYAPDVEPIMAQAQALYGPSEWRAAVLTNELHGHLGIYATIGVKMGIRAREYFNIGVDDIEATTYAGCRPPVSCMNDGLQVGTGATVGHGLLHVAQCDPPRPEALFCFKGKTIRLRLKPEYAARIRRDVQRGIELHGAQTEEYWQYIRALALQYWLEFDRHEVFDLETVETK